MSLEYKVSEHYFQNMKKCFYEGKIFLFSDRKIIGLLEDKDYKPQRKRFVFGFYRQDFIENIYFIKTPQLNESVKQIFIYSLTKENLSSGFEGNYKGFWIGIEPYFEGKISTALGISEMSDKLKNILQQKPEESLKKLKNLYFPSIVLRYFSEDILNRLDSLPRFFKQDVNLTISKV